MSVVRCQQECSNRLSANCLRLLTFKKLAAVSRNVINNILQQFQNNLFQNISGESTADNLHLTSDNYFVKQQDFINFHLSIKILSYL